MALIPALIAAATTAVAAKYQSNIRNDPKANVGSGQAPSIQPGGDIQVTPVGGSQVKDFGDFGSENMLEPEDMTEVTRIWS